jgi:hypothetical protein
MIADVLTFKGFRGWTCGDTADTLTWNEAEAGRPAPSAAELLAWEAEHVASKNANAARLAADEAEKADAKQSTVVKYLVSHTNTEIQQYVGNVANLADLKTIVGHLAVAVAVLARRELR